MKLKMPAPLRIARKNRYGQWLTCVVYRAFNASTTQSGRCEHVLQQSRCCKAHIHWWVFFHKKLRVWCLETLESATKSLQFLLSFLYRSTGNHKTCKYQTLLLLLGRRSTLQCLRRLSRDDNRCEFVYAYSLSNIIGVIRESQTFFSCLFIRHNKA